MKMALGIQIPLKELAHFLYQLLMDTVVMNRILNVAIMMEEIVAIRRLSFFIAMNALAIQMLLRVQNKVIKIQ